MNAQLMAVCFRGKRIPSPPRQPSMQFTPPIPVLRCWMHEVIQAAGNFSLVGTSLMIAQVGVPWTDPGFPATLVCCHSFYRFGIVQEGVLGKGVGNNKNASEMRQKCVKMGLVLLGKRGTFQECVRNASKMRLKCVKNARNTFGGEHLLDDTDRWPLDVSSAGISARMVNVFGQAVPPDQAAANILIHENTGPQNIKNGQPWNPIKRILRGVVLDCVGKSSVISYHLQQEGFLESKANPTPGKMEGVL